MIGGRMSTLFVLFLAGAAALLCWLIYDLGYTSGQNEVRSAWEAQKAADAEANARAAKQAREIEQGLLRHIDEIRRSHENNIAAIHKRHDIALDKLRKRASRPDNYVPPAATPAGAESAPHCSGDQLFRPDGEFLAGLAAAADTVRASLSECRDAYDAARKVSE